LHPPLHIQNGCREDLFRQKTRLASQHRRLSFHSTENVKSDVLLFRQEHSALLVDHFCSTLDKLIVTTYLSFNSYDNFIINAMFATSFITPWFKNYQFRKQYNPIAMLVKSLVNPALQPRTDSQRYALKQLNKTLFLLYFYWVVVTIFLFISWIVTTMGNPKGKTLML
jgi:hypothetical protein